VQDLLSNFFKHFEALVDCKDEKLHKNCTIFGLFTTLKNDVMLMPDDAYRQSALVISPIIAQYQQIFKAVKQAKYL